MKCERFRDELEGWLDGGLNADDRAGLERHAGGCPGCAQHLSQRRAMGAALKKTFRNMGSELHFQPRSHSWRPVEERPSPRRPWFRPPLSAITALAAVMIVVLLFLFHPWTKPRHAFLAGEPPARVITISDSLNIANEAFVSGCTADVCYSIDMQFSDFTINDPS